MATNTRKYKSTKKELDYMDDNRKVHVVIDKQSDGSVIIGNVTMTVSGGNLRTPRTKTESILIRGAHPDEIKTTVKFGRLGGYIKYMISIIYNINTLEVSSIYVMKE